MVVAKKSPVKKETVKKTLKKSTAPVATKAVTTAPKTQKTSDQTAMHNTISLPVVDTAGKDKGTIEAPKQLFAAPINKQLIAQAVRVYLANQRQGSAATKTRGQVTGSTRKIYRQKGTGRARHGGIRAPIFVGGGIAFGPHPHDFSRQLPDKMRRIALAGSISQKVADKTFIVVDGLDKLEQKTKQMAQTLKTLTTKPTVLVITDGKSENVIKSARNISGVRVLPAASLNTYVVFTHQSVVCMKQAIQPIIDTFIKN